jgi:tetratricopeptide (TPR) repeat protein
MTVCRQRTRSNRWLVLIPLLASLGCGRKPADNVPGSQECADALSLLEGDKVAEARTALDSAITKNPRHAKAFFLRGTVSDREHQLPSAVGDYTKAIQISEASFAGQDAHQVLLDEEELADTYYRRGEALAASGNFASAIDDFSKVIRQTKGSVRAFCGRSTAFMKAGLIELALDDLNEALKQDPYQLDALCQRARVHMAMGNPHEAIRDCKLAIRNKPESAQGYYVLGAAYACGTHPNLIQLITCYETALQRDKDNRLPRAVRTELAEAYFNHGVSLETVGKRTEAEDVYRRAKDLDATRFDLLRGQQTQKNASVLPVGGTVETEVLVSKARAMLGKREFDAAVESFTEALRSNPRSAEAYFGRGRAFLEKGFPDTAAEDFEQVICLKRDDAPPQAYCQLAQAHLLLKKTYLALEEATEAIRRKPNYALAYYYRGMAYLQDRDDSRATADFTEAAALAAHPKGTPAGMYEAPALDPDVLTEAKKHIPDAKVRPDDDLAPPRKRKL